MSKPCIIIMTHVTIKGIDGMRLGEIELEVQDGARFLMFQYCFSIVFMTFRRTSDIYFIRKDEAAWKRYFRWTFISFLFGWWGIPWGFIYTPSVIFHNLKGGKDVTDQVMEHFYSGEEEHEVALEAYV